MSMYGTKHVWIRSFFMIEIALFSLFYYFGSHGLKEVFVLKKENRIIDKQVDLVKGDIAQLESEILTWQTDPFYKEKLAREKLHMAKKDEEIYLTS